MRTACVFPGQGVGQETTLGLWYVGSVAVRRLVDHAARVAGAPVEHCFARGGRALAKTDILQPILTAVMLGIHEELEARGCRPDIVAGHSLGELAAVAVAGCIDPVGAVELAALRGRLMAREAVKHPGAMIALDVSSGREIREALAFARAYGIAAVAAENAPGHWVISGEGGAIRALSRRLSVRPLPVSGPWHSAAMADAVKEFRQAARLAVTAEMRMPLVCNRTGGMVESAEAIPDLLAEQLTHPIAWTATLATIRRAGVREFVIPGPGKVMRSLVRRNLGEEVAVRLVGVPEHLEPMPEAVLR